MAFIDKIVQNTNQYTCERGNFDQANAFIAAPPSTMLPLFLAGWEDGIHEVQP